MIHPSYVDLMKVVNKDVEEGETPVINSRYSIVMATAKRARQIVDGDEPLVKVSRGEKPLSSAVDELNQGEIRILAEDEVEEDFIVDEAAEENDGGSMIESEDVVTEEEAGSASETIDGQDAGSAEETAEEYPEEEMTEEEVEEEYGDESGEDEE